MRQLIAEARRLLEGPDAWGVDVRVINQWLKKNLPFWAKIARNRGGVVDIGAESGKDLSTFMPLLARAFPKAKIDQPGMKNYVRMKFPYAKQVGEDLKGPKAANDIYLKCRAKSDDKAYCARVAWQAYCTNINPDYKGCTKYGKTSATKGTK